MRSLLPLLCLGAAVLAADMKEEFPKVPAADMKEEFPKVPAAGMKEQFPSVLAFGLHLNEHADKYGIKPEVAEATNLTAELEHWNAQADKPTMLAFLDDDGVAKPANINPNMFSTFSAPLFDNDNGITFYYFNKYYPEPSGGKLGKIFHKYDAIVNIDNVTKVGDQWDSSLPLKVLIHGFGNSVIANIIAATAEAYLKNGKFNVIGVDWGKLCPLPNYFAARAHVAPTGAVVGKLVEKIIDAKMADPDTIHFIGHSLGAHVAGIAAKTLNNGPIGRVTGLDPAGPLFWWTKPDGRLAYTDAKLVDVIHSNAGLYGKSIPLGHVDFYVNGGQVQPNCKDDIIDACSHGRAVDMFIDTILTHRGYDGDLCGRLPGRGKGVACKSVYKAVMGDDVKFAKQGTYYVDSDGFPMRKSAPVEQKSS